MNWFRILILATLLAAAGARAADTDSPQAAASTEPDTTSDQPEVTVDQTEGKPIEGVTIEALETYQVPKNNQMGIALGVFPFNSYFTGWALSAFYDYRINKSVTWEIINAAYVFSTATNLTTQLAQTYSVNPQTIEKLQYIASTDFLFTTTRGKLLFRDDFIRNFTYQLIVGLGLLNTTQTSEVFGSVGLGMEQVLSDTFTVRLEFRDMIAVDGRNFAYFTLGTGLNF
jgi:outer membrane beta-barrel protein